MAKHAKITSKSILALPKETMQDIYNVIYPIGYEFIGFTEPVVPSTVVATWELDTTYDGKALWVDSTQTAGTTLAGSLPDITGTRQLWVAGWQANQYANGCFTATDSIDSNNCGSAGSHQNNSGVIYFKASNSNSIYSAAAGANVVRPDSVVVHMWKRTA